MSDHTITLTYINIRQSIAILLTKLILINMISAVIVIFFYFSLVKGEGIIPFIAENTTLFLTVFIIIGILEMFLDIYVILKWLNEYYEITPEHIVHKKGIIFRKTEQYRLDYVRAMDVEDTLLGEIFNFATITLYDIRLNKYMDMYLIHNPDRYAKILKTLRPHIEIKKDRTWLPFLPKEQNGTEE